MRAQAVEHEADEKSPAPGAEARREETSVAVSHLAAAPATVFAPGLLLGLQAGAGNAAVAGLIEQRRRTELPRPRPPAPPTAASGPGAAMGLAEVGTSPPAPETAAPDAAGSQPATGSMGSAGLMVADAPAEPADENDLSELEAKAASPAPEHAEDVAAAQYAVAAGAEADLEGIAAAGGSSGEPGGQSEPGIAIAERPAPVPSDVSSSPPSQALGQISRLPPAQLLSSLGSVSAAVGKDAARAQQQLVQSPPQRMRYSGAPATALAPVSAAPLPADRSISAAPKPAATADTLIQPPADLPHLPEAVAPSGQLPTHDPALGLSVGPLPHLPSEGNTDPSAIQQHEQAVIGQIDQEHQAEAQIAGQPLGEDSIFPVVSKEILQAHLPQAPATNGHQGAAPAGETDEAASIIAQQEKRDEIGAAVAGASSAIAEQKGRYAEQSAADRVAADTEMAQLEKANADEQTAERAAAKREVLGIRGQWTAEQQQLVAGARSEADLKRSETLGAVSQERRAAEAQAAEHYRQGQDEANLARRQAEAHAAAEKQKAQSGGLLGAIGSAAQSLFDTARKAVQSVFDVARQLVRSALERARHLAMAVLDRARLAIVNTIRAAGSALTAIGDRVLVAFPVLRDRFRRLIRDRIAAAEALVNRLAATLKESVQAVLNGLSRVLTAAIGLMQAAMQAAVDGLRATIRGALEFAKGAISAFGAFAALVKDVAANPGQWLSNLAAGVRDGIANHLWPDLKAAVQGWFNDKVDSVLGLGSAVWSLLKRGGITVAQIATTAWEGLKAMLPQTVIWVLIEKLVALIVPAAAAVMLIIQALQAAWASVGRIVQAFDAFVAFLKSVRNGNAGPLFGSALAKSAVAVIEFISQFLLQRLMGAAGAVASKIRALAKRIGARLAAAGRGLARGAKWVGAKGRAFAEASAELARGALARPQLRWHAWRLKRVIKADPKALSRMQKILTETDPAIDPALKLDYTKLVRTYLRKNPSTSGIDAMRRVIIENPDRFTPRGSIISESEIQAAKGLAADVPLEDVYADWLTDDQLALYPTFDRWAAALRKDPSKLDPTKHFRPEAKLGRWFSPRSEARETRLGQLIEERQLSAGRYSGGSMRVFLKEDTAIAAGPHRPTAFDAVFIDEEWQQPPAEAVWGSIKTPSRPEGIREAVLPQLPVSKAQFGALLLPEEHFQRTPAIAAEPALARGR